MASKVVGNLIVNLAANIASFESAMRKANATTQRELKAIEKRSKETQQKIKAFGAAMAGAFAAIGAASAVRGIVRASVEVERLEAALVTVTGSQEAANAQFKTLQAFAAKTPFQLQEVVDGYIKLKARGLDPSIAAMTAFGNVAGATGKTLDMFIEAVGDAATGEMERLKEFGIVARQQGDKVRFTFQGVTTEVERNSDAIVGYLRNIGETKFAGGMERQANTIGGALSNLQDAVFNIMSSGDTEGLKQSIRELSAELSDPDTQSGIQNLISGLMTLTSWLATAAAKFAGFGKGVGEFFAQMAVGPAGKAFENAREVREEIEKINKQIEAQMSSILGVNGNGGVIDTQNMPPQLARLFEIKDQLVQILNLMTAIPPTVEVPTTESGDAAAPEFKPDEKSLESLEKLNQKLREQVAMFGMSDTAALQYRLTHGDLSEALRKSGEQGDEFAASIIRSSEELAALAESAQAVKEVESLTASVMTAQERYNAEIARYTELMATAGMSQETFNRLQAEAQKKLEGTTKGFDIMQAAAEEVGRALQSAFADFFYSIGKDTDNMLRNFVDAMHQMLSQFLAFQSMTTIFKEGTGIGNWLRGMPAPGHAAIGGLASGPTIVGEHGPELLNLPRMSHVTPNSKLGGTTVIVNQDNRGATSPDQIMAFGERLRGQILNDVMRMDAGYSPA